MSYKFPVSVIIASYNTLSYTRNCLNSLFQNRKSKKEIIVIDNGSTDGSVKYLTKLSETGKIKLILNSENKGFSYACNQGIKVSLGKHKLLLNSDTVVLDDAVNQLVDFADSNSDAGVVGSRLLNPDKTIQPSCINFPTLTNAFLEFFLNRKGSFSKFYPSGQIPAKVDVLVGASFLITQRAINKVGLLNEKYYFYYEDHDYCRRVRDKGLITYYLPSSLVVHYHGASGKNVADESNQWRRLIPSSKIYHGWFYHEALTALLWLGQKWQKVFFKKV